MIRRYKITPEICELQLGKGAKVLSVVSSGTDLSIIVDEPRFNDREIRRFCSYVEGAEPEGEFVGCSNGWYVFSLRA